MKYRYLVLAFFIFSHLLSLTRSARVVGWWVGAPNDSFSMENFNWDVYTHLRFGSPLSYPNGTAFCNKTDDSFQNILKYAHAHNVKVQWSSGITDIHDILWNPEKNHIRGNYLNSIGNAVRDCGADGIEIDYEFGDSKYMKWGIVSYGESTIYSQFLSELKKSLGQDKIVSADVSIWGVAPGNWILGVLPWINATMLNRGDFDFINTMSYHWSPSGYIWPWKKDGWFIDKWGIDRNRVNIGIPYFSENRTKDMKIYNEPTWQGLSPLCPNIDPEENICEDIVFVGKKMNYKLGKWIQQEGFGGAFPWAANYDSIQFNNSLVEWLAAGLQDTN